MKELNVIIAILENLKNAMEDGEIDPSLLTADYYDVNQNVFNRLLEMMFAEELIEGIAFVAYDGHQMMTGRNKTKITLRGLEYLERHRAYGWK